VRYLTEEVEEEPEKPIKEPENDWLGPTKNWL
jgi:hypothetical protein